MRQMHVKGARAALNVNYYYYYCYGFRAWERAGTMHTSPVFPCRLHGQPFWRENPHSPSVKRPREDRRETRESCLDFPQTELSKFGTSWLAMSKSIHAKGWEQRQAHGQHSVKFASRCYWYCHQEAEALCHRGGPSVRLAYVVREHHRWEGGLAKMRPELCDFFFVVFLPTSSQSSEAAHRSGTITCGFWNR